MVCEFRLKQRLQEAGLDGRGVISTMANDIGVHVATISGIYHNRRQRVNLETMARICQWLQAHGAGKNLPGALFGARPSSLVGALAEHDRIVIYLGERRPANAQSIAQPWLASVDFSVSNSIKTLLDEARGNGTGRRRATPHVEEVLVPARHASAGAPVSASDFEEDVAQARKRFDEMRSGRGRTSIIVGSQRSNYLLELFVADLLPGQTPFVAPTQAPPFYLLYPDHDHPASCFGGPNPPPGGARGMGRGIHFQCRSGGWEAVASRNGTCDAGMVIIRRDAGLGRTEVAVFGFSHAGTAAMAQILVGDPDQFWPSGWESRGGIDVRAHLCEIKLGAVCRTSGRRSAKPLRLLPLEHVMGAEN